MSDLHLFAAPLQGLTEAPFRAAHTKIYGVTVEYFGPFVRVEKGEPRIRDMRDATSPLNVSVDFTPQIILSDATELSVLTQALRTAGSNRIDINAGCPFPPQVRHGRGAGLLSKPENFAEIARSLSSEVLWSLKMRLGVDSPDQWRPLMPVINSAPLRHVTLHPRTARQLYSGTLYFDEFLEFKNECRHPVVFNGDIITPEDIDRVAAIRGLNGVMVGRGLLMRPSIFNEWIAGREWSEKERREALAELHAEIFKFYSGTLCGDSHVLMKMLPFWEYFGVGLDRKAVKKVLKSKKLPDYLSAADNSLKI